MCDKVIPLFILNKMLRLLLILTSYTVLDLVDVLYPSWKSWNLEQNKIKFGYKSIHVERIEDQYRYYRRHSNMWLEAG
jgi:hypothetical protein